MFISSGKRKRNMLGIKIQNSSINYPMIIYSLIRSAHGPIHFGPNKKNGAQISHAQQNIGESLSTAVYLLELALFQVRRNTFVEVLRISLSSPTYFGFHISFRCPFCVASRESMSLVSCSNNQCPFSSKLHSSVAAPHLVCCVTAILSSQV